MIKKNGKFVIFIFIIFLLGFEVYLLNNMSQTKPSLNSKSSLKQLAGDGTVSLNSEDLSSLFPLYLSKIDNNGPFKIENISSSIKDNKIGFNADIKVFGLNFPLSTKGELKCEDNLINYYPEKIKLGILTLPKKLVYKQLKDYIPINIEKDRIEIEKNKLPVEVAEVELNDDMLKIKFAKFKMRYSEATYSNEEGSNSTINSYGAYSEGMLLSKTPNTPSEKSALPSGKPSVSTSKQNLQAPSPKDYLGPLVSDTANNDLLKNMSSDLKKVYSATKTDKEKQLVQSMQNIVNQMNQNETYSYENDASIIMSQYNKLTSAEKNNLESIILKNMDITNLLKLGETLSAFSGF